MTGGRARVGLLITVPLVALVLIIWWVGVPTPVRSLSPTSHEADGTSAAMALLEELGAEVTVDVAPEVVADREVDLDVVLVLRDGMDDVTRAGLSGWAREGGVLVVADPTSALAPVGGLLPPDDLDRGRAVAHLARGECTVTALTGPGIDELVMVGGESRFRVGDDERSCFGNDRSAALVTRDVEEGTIVAIGGPGFMTNEALGRGDNAVVTAALLAPRPGTRVAVLDLVERREAGEDSLWDVMPTWAKQVMAQLGLAFLVYVLWRSRRLGKPITEPQPVKVAGSELVAAVGGLLQRTGSPQHAAELLRADLRRDLIQRLGLSPGLPPDAFFKVVEDRCHLDPDLVRWALGPGPVTTDADLLTVARTIDLVRKEVFESVGTTS